MSRALRFRAWDKTANEWFMDGAILDLNKCCKKGLLLWGGDPALHVTESDLILEQWTGEFDSSGAEIFDGHIICARKFLGPDDLVLRVEINERDCMGMSRIEIGYGLSFLLAASESVEIIGNVHQHPELLPTV